MEGAINLFMRRKILRIHLISEFCGESWLLNNTAFFSS